jgi:AcrR family transcriptional regulator
MRRGGNIYNIRTYSADGELVQERRRAIVDNSARVFIKKGYHQATMREIAQACKMSVGAIYHYVGSKQDILYLIINDAVSRPEGWREDLDRRCRETSPGQVLREFIDMYYRTVDRSQDICLFTYQETKNLDAGAQRVIREAAEEDVAACAGILEKGAASGVFKISNVTLTAHDIVTMGHMWAVRRWYLRPRCTLDQYIQEHTDLIYARISPESPINKQEARAEKWRAKQVHHV